MQSFIILFLTCSFLIFFVSFSKTMCFQLPTDIKKCHFDDNNCIVTSMNKAIRYYPKGIPKIGLKPFDAIQVEDVEINSSHDSPIWMDFTSMNTTVYGFDKTTITHVNGFTKNGFGYRINIFGHVGNITHKGFYRRSTKWFLFYSNSTGKRLGEFQNFRFKLTLKAIIQFRESKRYLKVEKIVPVLEIDRFILKVDHLYSENSDLALILNKVVNDNWVLYWNELEPLLQGLYSKMFMDILGPIFDRTPYDDMFL